MFKKLAIGLVAILILAFANVRVVKTEVGNTTFVTYSLKISPVRAVLVTTTHPGMDTRGALAIRGWGTVYSY